MNSPGMGPGFTSGGTEVWREELSICQKNICSAAPCDAQGVCLQRNLYILTARRAFTTKAPR